MTVELKLNYQHLQKQASPFFFKGKNRKSPCVSEEKKRTFYGKNNLKRPRQVLQYLRTTFFPWLHLYGDLFFLLRPSCFPGELFAQWLHLSGSLEGVKTTLLFNDSKRVWNRDFVACRKEGCSCDEIMTFHTCVCIYSIWTHEFMHTYTQKCIQFALHFHWPAVAF